jgi:two-component system CheB/CheR fusion protein
LPELLDMSVLQKLTEANHKASGMPIGIIDALDGSLLVGFGWQEFCVRFHRSDAAALEQCRESKQPHDASPREHTCKNGLHDIAIPIVVGGEHLATFFLGQFFYEGEKPDRERFVAQARELGLDEGEYLAAFDRVPVLGRAAVRNILQYDEALAHFISELAERTLAQARQQDALRDREEWFRAIVETVPHMVFVGEDGGNVYNNARLEQYTGMTSDALRGYGWTQTIHPDEAARAAEIWSRSQVTGEPFTSINRVRRHDGEYRWFLTAAAPLRDRAGRIVRWIGTWTDIHDRVRAEEALREGDRRKDEFLAVLSHELRNPLAPIQNAYNIMERVDPLSDQALRARAVIGRQVDHLTRLVDDLLDVTRISRGKVQLRRSRVDLGATVRRTMEDLRADFASRNIALELREPAGTTWVDGDATRLAQVVGNLLANAAKFTEPGGHVSVTIDRVGESATIRVRDDGVGIAPDVLRTLFEPFTQADRTLHRARGGLGLGLALVKGIVELHGGRATARSEGEGRGAEFTISLPIAAEEGDAAAGDRPARHAARRRILVVEDNEDAAVTLRDLLELDGHEVHVAGDGETALRAALRLRPDVILCDVGLPGVDGYEVARRLRSSREADAITLVALTGYASQEDVERALGAGFDHHLGKPPDLDKLLRILARPRGPGGEGRAGA